MVPQPDLNHDLRHDLRNKIWAALEALKLFIEKSSKGQIKTDFSLLLKVKTALEQSLCLMEGNEPDMPENLNGLVSNSLVDLFPIARNKGIKLEVRSTQITTPVQTNKFSFLRIMHNLVLNAIEAANSEVVVQSGYWTDDCGRTIFPAVAIRNDGKGISVEKLSFVFGKGVSFKNPARGYGLHIVKTLLQTEGTLILFTSDDETNFFVVFDRDQEEKYA